MVDKAKENARLLRLRNVEVHAPDILAVPLEDACADVVISNGAINLAAQALRLQRGISHSQSRRSVPVRRHGAGLRRRDPELRPLGRLHLRDVEPQRYLEMLGAAGFRDAELVARTGYQTALTTIGATFRARKPEDRNTK